MSILSEARKRLSELLGEVERGGSVTITRHGKAVARLIPPEPKSRKPLPELGDFRAALNVGGKSLSETVIDLRAEQRY